MHSSEKEVRDEFVNKGYKFLTRGHPDFIFYKESNGIISDIIFVEVKGGGNNLSEEQVTYSRIMKSLNLNYIVRDNKDKFKTFAQSLTKEVYDDLRIIALKKKKDFRELSAKAIIDFVKKNKE